MREERGEAVGDERVPYLVGIDVGGTTVKVALVTLDGDVVDFSAVRTESMQTPEELAAAAERVRAMAQGFAGDGARIAAVGLALPGVVTPEDKLLLAPNVQVNLDGLVEALAAAFGVPVYPMNDANAAALGELWRGSGQGARNLVFVTLGTGVGGGIVIDGNVVAGRGGTGEIGHLPVEPDGLLCGCGNRGCLEMYTSARGLVHLYREACARRGQEPVALEHHAHSLPIFEAARAGDEVALEALAEYSGYLGRALAMIACTLDPDAFVVGGGMSAAFDLFGPLVADAYERTVIRTCRDIPIRAASLGNLAGMVGAAYHGARRSGLV